MALDGYSTTIVSILCGMHCKQNINISHVLVIIFRLACGVDLVDRYVVIGGKGQDAGRKTTMYKDSGFYRSLPELVVGRAAHGCSQFQNGNGETVCLLLFLFFEN